MVSAKTQFTGKITMHLFFWLKWIWAYPNIRPLMIFLHCNWKGKSLKTADRKRGGEDHSSALTIRPFCDRAAASSKEELRIQNTYNQNLRSNAQPPPPPHTTPEKLVVKWPFFEDLPKLLQEIKTKCFVPSFLPRVSSSRLSWLGNVMECWKIEIPCGENESELRYWTPKPQWKLNKRKRTPKWKWKFQSIL